MGISMSMPIGHRAVQDQVLPIPTQVLPNGPQPSLVVPDPGGGVSRLNQLQTHMDTHHPIANNRLNNPPVILSETDQIAGYKAVIGYSKSHGEMLESMGANLHQAGTTTIGSALGFGVGYNATRLGAGTGVDFSKVSDSHGAGAAVIKAALGPTAGALAGGTLQHVHERFVVPALDRAPQQYVEIPNDMLVPPFLFNTLSDVEKQSLNNSIDVDKKAAASVGNNITTAVGSLAFGAMAAAGMAIAESVGPVTAAGASVALSGVGGLATGSAIAMNKYLSKTKVPVIETVPDPEGGDQNTYRFKRDSNDRLILQDVNLYYPHQMSIDDSNNKNANTATKFAEMNTVKDITDKSAAIGKAFTIHAASNVVGAIGANSVPNHSDGSGIKEAASFVGVASSVYVYFKKLRIASLFASRPAPANVGVEPANAAAPVQLEANSRTVGNQSN